MTTLAENALASSSSPRLYLLESQVGSAVLQPLPALPPRHRVEALLRSSQIEIGSQLLPKLRLPCKQPCGSDEGLLELDDLDHLARGSVKDKLLDAAA